MRVEPLPVTNTALTAPEQMLADAMKAAGNNPTALLPALNQILAKYPDFSDGYVMRLGALCNGNNLPAILSDINNAIKNMASSEVPSNLGSLLSMRAKIEHANGDDGSAIDDLDKAIHANLDKALEFSNSGAIAPEETASVCIWTEPDMDALVRRFPEDYRPYMFRALYDGFFIFFEHDANIKRDSLGHAFGDLNIAAKINPTSVLPALFKAEIFDRTFSLQMMNTYRNDYEQLNDNMLSLLDDVVAIDHDNIWALRHRAATYYNLKKWPLACPRFRRHRVRCFNGSGGGSWRDGSLRGSSSLRRCV
jgi:tetratricopeptide (TPR) repeat protein